jgi:ketosteroid isomerase-like protein
MNMRVMVLICVVFLWAGVLLASEESDVSATIVKEAEAFQNKDIKTFEQLWAHDDWVTVFEQGSADIGWSKYRDHHLMMEIKGMKNVTYEHSEIRTQVRDNVAWASFKFKIVADYGERHIDADGIGTAILEKREGAWKIVHMHTSSNPKTKKQ